LRRDLSLPNVRCCQAPGLALPLDLELVLGEVLALLSDEVAEVVAGALLPAPLSLLVPLSLLSALSAFSDLGLVEP
jgi:hypothetical protein